MSTGQQDAPPRNEPPANVPRDQRRDSRQEQQAQKKSKGGKGVFFLIVVGILIVLAILAVAAILPRLHRNRERDETKQAIGKGAQTVRAVKPTHSPASFDFSLPGSAEPLTTATLFARVNGYLKTRLVDIGDRVQEGQLLAQIDAPDIDAQYRQTNAQLEQSRAALGIAQVTFEREKKLLGEKVVSKQEYDQAEATYNQAVANVKAAEASLQNLTVQKGFEQITAPFAGTITTRYLDDGALISTGGTSAPSLYTLQQMDILRVYIYVPQTYVANVHPDQEVEVTATEYPQKVFKGKVTRMAESLDPVTRTERVEIQLPSEGGKLLPGMYLGIRFRVEQNEPALLVPANTVDIRREGPRVASITPDNKLKFLQVKLGRDFGKTLEIVSGLTGDEQIVLNPTSELRDGQDVQIAKPEDDKKSGPDKGGNPQKKDGDQADKGSGQKK